MTAAALRRDSPRGDRNLVEGEYPFTAEDFLRIAALLRDDSGIHLTENKATLVYSRLAKRLRALGLKSFEDYCAMVAGPDGAEERRTMLAALTTNVTRFFREPHHFDDLRGRVLEPLAEAARQGERIRIWSAACSTGQEPYSIGLTVLRVLPEAADLDIRVLATDIDPVVVARAREGFYGEEAIAAIPIDDRRWLSREPEGWRAGEELRRIVAFRELNLLGDWPMTGRFQAIFCRNVAIYFEDATQKRLWERLAGALAPEGRLYIGHSERAALDCLEPDGLTSYRLAGPAR